MSTALRSAQEAPIPFREEGPSVADGITVALGVLVLLLAAVMALLTLARRRGIALPAWLGKVTEPAGTGMAVEARLRLSPRTVVYRVRDGDTVLHVVESVGAIQVREVTQEPSS